MAIAVMFLRHSICLLRERNSRSCSGVGARPRLAGAVLGVGLPFGMAWIAGMMLHK
jgi:hypothetical protein